MEAPKLLDEILSHGLKVEIKTGLLFVGPREVITDELRELIKAHTSGLLALLSVKDVATQWRVAAMLEQLLPLRWPCPIPSLFAIPDTEPEATDCKSCGEFLAIGEGDSFICGACSRAKDIALTLWTQRPAQGVRAA